MEVGGIEPHTRVAGQGLTLYCDHFVTVFLACLLVVARPETALQFVFNS
jgi:hypothetical protein